MLPTQLEVGRVITQDMIFEVLTYYESKLHSLAKPSLHGTAPTYLRTQKSKAPVITPTLPKKPKK